MHQREKGRQTMEKLTDLPNIGPKLRELGAETAFLRIRTQVDSTACLHQLEALAGAAEGVRKSLLPPERKTELKDWFRSL